MARYFFLLLMVGGVALFMYVTKPSQTDYLERLKERADGMAALEQSAFQHVRSGDPIEEMLAAQSPEELIAQTTLEDYGVISLFTTDFAAPGYGPRRVRVVGFFSVFIAYRVRDI